MKDDKVFIDTNILVYAYDISALEKHETARHIIIDMWDSRNGILSIQVLQEFFVTVTKKIPKPLKIDNAAQIIRDFLHWEIFINDGESMLDAIAIQVKYHFSFWDSMIVGSAIKSGANILLSEDLTHNKNIEGITIINPFKQ